MRKIIILCSLFLSSPLLAIDADFSKSFVIPEKSGVNTITLGGIDAVGRAYRVDFNLREDLTLSLTDASTQESPREVLEQTLRNTTWEGTYVVNDDNFTTTLKFIVVQNGYVAGEIIHSESVVAGNGLLHMKVAGNIITQFKVNGSFVDEDRINTQTLKSLATNTPQRQLIRIQRMQMLAFRNDNNRWKTNREYRLLLEDGSLSGVVGAPNATVGLNDETTNNGKISLSQP